MQAHELPTLADAPGTSREYETIYILRPNTTNEEVAEVNVRVRNLIESMGGKIINVENWGKRRLAYEIAKERKGIYLHWTYLASHHLVSEIERTFRMLDGVIRYLTVKLDKDIDPNARPTDIDDETYERAANTAADEEDMYLTRREGEDDDDYSDDDDSDDDLDDSDDDDYDISSDRISDDSDLSGDSDDDESDDDNDDDEQDSEE